MHSIEFKNLQQSTLMKSMLLFFLVAGFIGLFFPAWQKLVSHWYNSEEYSHGFLVVPISLYIVWQKKDVIAKASVRPSNWGLAICILSLMLYVAAYLAEISTISSFSMVPFVAGIVLYLFGFEIFKIVFFPILFLCFMIPVPNQIFSTLTVPLQLFVSKISAEIASLLHVPIYRDGNILHLPDRTLAVVHACSGLRSLISLITISTIFGYFTLNRNILRGLLILSSIPIAILVNIIRVLLMVISFYYLSYDLTAGIIHTFYGIFIFILAIIFLALSKGVMSSWDKSIVQK